MVANVTNATPTEVPHYPLALEDWVGIRCGPDRKLADEFRRTFEKTPLLAYRPLPHALNFHRSAKRFRWALGGNRSSKSHSVATEVMWYATGLHPFRRIMVPNETWYCGLTWEKVGDTLWPKIHAMLDGMKYRVTWHNKALDRPASVYVRVPGGESVITFKAFEQGREIFQSVDKRLVANDEQFSQEIFTEQISRIGGRYPLDFVAALTPINPQPWLEERMMLNRPDNWDVFNFPLGDNRVSRGGFIDDGEIDALLDEWPEEIRPTRERGEWAALIGAIFQTFRRDVHVLDLAQEKELLRYTGDVPFIVPQIRSLGSIDWGGANPFVYLWATQIPWADGLWYVFDEYYWDPKRQGQRRLDEHAAEIKRRTEQWRTVVDRTWADHDPTDALMMAHYGVPNMPAQKDNNSVSAGVDVVRTLFKVRKDTGRPRLLFAKRCKMLAREIAGYRYKEPTELQDPKDGAIVKKDDHAVDALRYLLRSEGVVGDSSGVIVTKLPNTGPRRQF